MKSQARALKELVGGLNSSQIRYLVGGSVASSVIGFPRATLDTDVLVEIQQGQVAALAASLGNDWYLDVEFARQSVAHRCPFNLIEMGSGYKFDLFPAYSLFHEAELDRATIRHLRIAGETVACRVATAEDMILAKMQWYREGGEVSERQWTDVVGMLKVGGDFDSEYLGKWAVELRVRDLLERAIRAAADNS